MGEPKIVVVDYHKGNLSSVVRGLARAGAAACTSDDPEQIRNADGLVILGVGAFYDAIAFYAPERRGGGRARCRCCRNSAARHLPWDFNCFLSAATRGVPADEGGRRCPPSRPAVPGVDGFAYYARLVHISRVGRLPEGAARGLGPGAHDACRRGRSAARRFCRGRQHVFHPQLRGGRMTSMTPMLGAYALYAEFPCIVRHGNVWGLPVPSREKSSALGQRIARTSSTSSRRLADDSVPAIDLIGGKVVRSSAATGAAARYIPTTRGRCPLLCRAGRELGARRRPVRCLRRGRGHCAANSAAIKAICGVDGLSVDVGGGVRSLARIDELAGYGARRIALGTVLVTEPGFSEVAARGFGELLVADIAARDGQSR